MSNGSRLKLNRIFTFVRVGDVMCPFEHTVDRFGSVKRKELTFGEYIQQAGYRFGR